MFAYFFILPFRWERREEEKEKAEDSLQHFDGSHKVDDTDDLLLELMLNLHIDNSSILISVWWRLRLLFVLFSRDGRCSVLKLCGNFLLCGVWTFFCHLMVLKLGEMILCVACISSQPTADTWHLLNLSGSFRNLMKVNLFLTFSPLCGINSVNFCSPLFLTA